MSATPWLARLSWAGAGAFLAGAGFVVASQLPTAAPVVPAPHQRNAPAVDTGRPGDPEARAAECWLGVVLSGEAVDVVAESDGRIREMAVDVGDKVVRGQRLAILGSETVRHQRAIELADLAAAEAELRRVTLEAERAEQNHRRRLGLEGLLSREEIATSKFELEAARARLEVARAKRAQVQARLDQLDTRLARAEIRAPFDAMVALRYLDPGAMASAGMPLLRLIGSTGLVVRFAVPPGEVAALAIGSEVRVDVETSDVVLEGTVEHFMPEIDAASQRIFVEARLSSPAALRTVPSGAAARVSQALEGVR